MHDGGVHGGGLMLDGRCSKGKNKRVYDYMYSKLITKENSSWILAAEDLTSQSQYSVCLEIPDHCYQFCILCTMSVVIVVILTNINVALGVRQYVN